MADMVSLIQLRSSCAVSATVGLWDHEVGMIKQNMQLIIYVLFSLSFIR